MTGAARNILATGFVADSRTEGSIFPSAGGNSADPRVQAVYWRCIAVFFASARITNSDLDLVLFTNARPPVLNGVDIVEWLERCGVDIRQVPIAHRMPASRTQSWGNVLYFIDIMASLEDEIDASKVALVDSDIVVTRPLDPLYARTGEADFVVYPVDSEIEEDINGMTRADMTAAASELFERRFAAPVTHFGGELLAMGMAAWREHAALIDQVFRRMCESQGAFAKASTEEHIYSIAFAGLDGRIVSGEDVLRRIWTSPRHNTVQKSDPALAMWHLPAEKRYGFADLFGDIVSGALDLEMSPDDFRHLAGQRCGLPRKSARKLAFDGVRQIAAKLGIRA